MTDLKQIEADALIALPKYRSDERVHELPGSGGKLALELFSKDRHEKFVLDISRGRIDLSKVTYQARACKVIVLVRVDLCGPPHRNPDDEEISCPHIHMYREGYGDKWAKALPDEYFSAPTDEWNTLIESWSFCTIVNPPIFRQRLFP